MSEKDKPLLVRVFGERRVLRFEIKWGRYVAAFGMLLLFMCGVLEVLLTTSGTITVSVAATFGFRYVFGYDLKAIAWWILLASVLLIVGWYKISTAAEYVRETID